MNRLSFLYFGIFALLIIACKNTDDEMPPIDNCPSDMSLGRIDIETTTINFISQEMRDSTEIIFVDENDNEMVFFVSDDNMGQEYLRLLDEKNRTINCGSETFQAQLTPQEFFLIIESEDERSTITWKVTVEANYDPASNGLKLTDELTVTASGNIDGLVSFVNDKSNNEVPELVTGAFYPEVRIHGVPFKDVYLDQPAVAGVIDDSNIVVNLDFGIAAFKDRMGFWWRHKDFR